MARQIYQLIDSGLFRKLEQIGPYRLIRPSAQSIWEPKLPKQEWDKADAVFTRTSGGDGSWNILNRKIPDEWMIESGPIKLVIRLTDFGHVGLFPEHHDWAMLKSQIDASKKEKPEFKVLNLFAYTGATSLAAASFGANVTHIDASKTSVSWARENAAASNMTDKPVRWIVEDVQKFVSREIRRESKYEGVILDPPSFGRGPRGDVWKVEDHLIPLMKNLKEILSKDYSFFQLSAHSQGMTPIALENVLRDTLKIKTKNISAFEMTVSEAKNGRRLPSGACAVYQRHI